MQKEMAWEGKQQGIGRAMVARDPERGAESRDGVWGWGLEFTWGRGKPSRVLFIFTSE